MKEVLTVRLDPATRKRLESLSEATARSRSYLISEAIAEYLSVNEWQVAAIRQAVREADAPGATLLSHEEVVARLKEKRPRVKKGR